jgi:hypothetical protein
MNALGLLQISCVSSDSANQQSWPLEFNLRPHEQGSAGVPGREAPIQIKPNATTDALETARKQIRILFDHAPDKGKKDKVTAGTIVKSLEGIVGSPRSGWNGALLRALWPALDERLRPTTLGGSRRSLAHFGRISVAPGLRRCPRRSSHGCAVAAA